MKNLLREAIIIIVLAAVIYGLLFFVIQGVPVLGSSMEPNLASSGQRVLIVKAAYWFGHEPQRGDIIVFQPPDDWPNARHLPFIKRVIGLPGDTVEIKAGQIYINDSEQALAEPYIKKSFTYSTMLITVPEDFYYVLGDNRDISEDSHLYGPISQDSIIGKAWLSYWPFRLWGTVANYRFAE